MIHRARSARGRPPRKLTFYEKRRFRSILAHFGPSRPHKWIRLEILHLGVSVSCQTEPVVKFYDQITVKDRQLPSENVNYVVKITFHDSTPNHIYNDVCTICCTCLRVFLFFVRFGTSLPAFCAFVHGLLVRPYPLLCIFCHENDLEMHSAY